MTSRPGFQRRSRSPYSEAGALSGLDLRPPGENDTCPVELARLRLAVTGGDKPLEWLAATLSGDRTGSSPRVRKREEWVGRERVRRLDPVGLVAAIRAEEPRPERSASGACTRRAGRAHRRRLREPTAPLVPRRGRRRLRRLGAALDAQRAYAPLVEVEDLLGQLRHARHVARFLDEVGRLKQVPTRVSMVLLKRPEYRSMLESYLRFRRSAFVQLDEPALEAPLENLPYMYELWGTLQLIEALLDISADSASR